MEEIRASKEYLCSYGTAVHCEVFRQYKNGTIGRRGQCSVGVTGKIPWVHARGRGTFCCVMRNIDFRKGR